MQIEGLSAKAEGLSPGDKTLRDLNIFISYESQVTRQNKTVTETNLANDTKVTVHRLLEIKSAKITEITLFCLCCVR